MKKLLAIIVLGLLWSGNLLAERTTVNDLLKDGYKIINEDIVSRTDSTSFIKVLTLQNRNSALMICTVAFDAGGTPDDMNCVEP